MVDVTPSLPGALALWALGTRLLWDVDGPAEATEVVVQQAP